MQKTSATTSRQRIFISWDSTASAFRGERRADSQVLGDLVHQVEDDFDAGKVHAAMRAQVFDALQGADGFAIEAVTAVVGIQRGRDEAVFVISENGPARHMGDVLHCLEGINRVGFGLKSLKI